MIEIIDKLRNGSSSDRLAVISDLFTIVGISGAAIIAPLWVFDSFSIDAFLGISVTGFMTLFFLALLLLIALFISDLIKEHAEKGIFCFLSLLMAWSLFLVLFITILAISLSLIVGTSW